MRVSDVVASFAFVAVLLWAAAGGAAPPVPKHAPADAGTMHAADARGAGDGTDAGDDADDLAALHACERKMVEPLAGVFRTSVPGTAAGETERSGAHSPAFTYAAKMMARDSGFPAGAVEYVIATVPDPVDSGMYYMTDRILEAIQRGVAARASAADGDASDTAQAWRKDRFWSPWADADGDADGGTNDDGVAACRRLVPGLLAFRNDSAFGAADARPQLLVVFLVGEAPTWGIHKTALVEALDFIHESRAERGAGPEEIRIIGPTFSGSSPSLQYALASWSSQEHAVDSCFTVVSGNATSHTNKTLLETCDAEDHDVSCKRACADDRGALVARDAPFIHFHATTVPDDARRKVFWDYLEQSLHVEEDDAGAKCTLKGVAMLEESGTAYGDFARAPRAIDAGTGAAAADAAAPAPQREQEKRPTEGPARVGHVRARAKSAAKPHVDAASADGAGAADAGAEDRAAEDAATEDLADGAAAEAATTFQLGETDFCKPELTIPFPPHISNVRRVYEAQANQAASAAPTADPMPGLNPSLDEPSEPLDIFPSLSPRTAFSNDIVLANIMDELSERGVGFVGIVATDPSDTIFLASQVKAHLPDARLFTFGSEVLLAHPRYQADLNGMLVVSTYPLFGAHRILVADDGPDSGVRDRASFFSGEQEEGAYNATVAILGKRAELLDYRRTVADAGAEPPVWITVIGRDGAFPLHEGVDFADEGDFVLDGAPSPAGPPTLVVRPPRAWLFVFFTLTVMAAYVGFAFWYARGREWSARGGRAPSSVPVWPPLARLFSVCSPFVAFRRAHCVALLFALLFGAQATLMAVGAIPWVLARSSLTGPDCVGLLAGVVVLGLLGTCLAAATWTLLLCALAEIRRSHAHERALAHAVERARDAVGLAKDALVDAGAAMVRAETATRPSRTKRSEAGRRAKEAARALAAARRAADAAEEARLAASWPGVWARLRTTAMLLVGLAAVGGGALTFVLQLLATRKPDSPVQIATFYVRATSFASGVSPLTPLLLFIGLCCLWALCNLTRLRIVSHVSQAAPAADGTIPGYVSAALGLAHYAGLPVTKGTPRDLPRLEQRLLRTLRYPVYEPLSWTIFLPMWFLPAYAFMLKPPATVEGTWSSAATSADVAFRVCLAIAGMIVSFSLVELLLAWHRTRTFLRRLARHPLAQAYGRTPDEYVRSLELQVSGHVPEVEDLAIAVHRLHTLVENAGRAAADDSELGRSLSVVLTPELRKLLERESIAAKVHLRSERSVTSSGNSYVELGRSRTVGHLVRASAAITSALMAAWRHGSLDGTERDASATSPAPSPAPSPPAPACVASQWVARAEEYVAANVTIFLYQYVRQFRQFMMLAVGSALVLMVAVASYCFEPHHLLEAFSSVALAASVVAVIYVFVAMDRDEILSRLARTPPGHVTLDRSFVFRILTWTVLPLASFIAVHYPQVAGALFFWIKPFLHALQ